MSPIQFTKTFNVEIRSHAKLRLQSAESKQAKGHGGHSRGSALDFGLIRIGVTFQTPSNQNRSSCIMFNMERLTLPLGNPHQTIREARSNNSKNEERATDIGASCLLMRTGLF